ncbi:hypothetical protein JYU03_00040 [bacterium AH-315-F03]|nr:hypothetical protein [bacterium AH-315-F03]
MYNTVNKIWKRSLCFVDIIKITTVTLIAFFCFTEDASSQYVPLNQPGSDLYYQCLMRAKSLNGPTVFSYQLAPYVETSDRYVAPIRYSYWSKSQHSLRFFVNPDETVEIRESSANVTQKLNGIERLRGGMSLRMGEKVSGYISFLLDETLANDPNYTGKVWRNVAGFVEAGLLSYQSEKLTVLFGRFRNSWGPTVTNPLLSQEAYPLDGVTLRYRAGKRLTYSYTLARLDGFSPDGAGLIGADSLQTVGVFVNRYFAAHRVDIFPNKNLRFGLFETVIFAGAGRGVELQYFNPLNFYHGAQLNEDGNDNTFLGFDFDWMLFRGSNLYGQIVVDDFQIENEVQGDQEPNEIGALVGLYLADIAGQSGWDADLRFDGVTNRTYNQKLERNRYLNHGLPLGHPLGNDFQRYSISLYHWFGGSAPLGRDNKSVPSITSGLLTFSSVLLRKGEGSISDLWSEPWLLSAEPYSEPYPTGVIERTWRHQLKYQRILSFSDDSQGYVSASFGWESIENLDHIQNQYRSSWFFALRMSLFYSTDWALD